MQIVDDIQKFKQDTNHQILGVLDWSVLLAAVNIVDNWELAWMNNFLFLARLLTLFLFTILSLEFFFIVKLSDLNILPLLDVLVCCVFKTLILTMSILPIWGDGILAERASIYEYIVSLDEGAEIIGTLLRDAWFYGRDPVLDCLALDWFLN